MNINRCDKCGVEDFQERAPGIWIKLDIGGHAKIPDTFTPIEMEKVIQPKLFCSVQCLTDWVANLPGEFRKK